MCAWRFLRSGTGARVGGDRRRVAQPGAAARVDDDFQRARRAAVEGRVAENHALHHERPVRIAGRGAERREGHRGGAPGRGRDERVGRGLRAGAALNHRPRRGIADFLVAGAGRVAEADHPADRQKVAVRAEGRGRARGAEIAHELEAHVVIKGYGLRARDLQAVEGRLRGRPRLLVLYPVGEGRRPERDEQGDDHERDHDLDEREAVLQSAHSQQSPLVLVTQHCLGSDATHDPQAAGAVWVQCWLASLIWRRNPATAESVPSAWMMYVVAGFAVAGQVMVKYFSAGTWICAVVGMAGAVTHPGGAG